MNQETNNEIDLLLRKLGRQGASASTDSTDEHLDADELNMYAENALAPKTRARYTEHLADCDRCRQIVSQLSMAAGLVVQEKKTEAPRPTGLKALLASFFTPMVLRYAVPALGLVLVTSIAVVVLRDSTTQKNAATQSVAKNETPAAVPELTDSSRNNSGALANDSGGKKSEAEQPRDEKQQTKSGEAEAAKESPEAKRDEPDKATDQVAGAPATTVASATPQAKPAVADEAPKAGQDVAEKKKQPAEGSADTIAVAKTTKEEEQNKRGVGGLSRYEPAKTKSAPSTGVQQRARENQTEEGRRADKDNAETRSVAGRQFRREGSAWIDTAYSSQATTIVARGSEQYRALVADEPALKTIADHLGGEVIVVWKGRAYRIR